MFSNKIAQINYGLHFIYCFILIKMCPIVHSFERCDDWRHARGVVFTGGSVFFQTKNFYQHKDYEKRYKKTRNLFSKM